MFKLLRKMAALPLKTLWLVLTVLPITPPPEWLLKWIYRIDPCERHAIGYLAKLTTNHEYEKISVVGQELYAKSPSCGLAAYLGLMAVQYGQTDIALQWRTVTQTYPQNGEEIPFHLDMALSPHLEDIDDEEIAARILARRDVSMLLTRSALDTQAANALLRQQWDQAETIINRIFAIEDPPHLRWMRWVLATKQGRLQEAERHFQNAWNQAKSWQAAMGKIIGWHILDDHQQSRNALQEAIQAGAPPDAIAIVCRQLGIEPPPPSASISEGT